MTAAAVVVLGDLMVDVVAMLRGPLIPASDSPASIAVRGGGSAANTACWLASIGVETVFVGKAGDDSAGREALAELRALGVRTKVTVDPNRRTGTVIVLVDEAGERTMVPDAGANSGLVEADLPTEEFTAGRHLHVSGYTLLNPASRATGIAALDLATKAGMSTSLDLSSAGPLAVVGSEEVRSWIRRSNVTFANLDEARTVTGVDDPAEAARQLVEDCFVVVKQGADGALWENADRDGPIRVPAYPLADADTDGYGDPDGGVIDTTGAGDAFAAGFLAAFTGDKDPEVELEDEIRRQLAAGCRLAAQAIRRVGGRPGFGS